VRRIKNDPEDFKKKSYYGVVFMLETVAVDIQEFAPVTRKSGLWSGIVAVGVFW
jgi:hypothetical protein